MSVRKFQMFPKGFEKFAYLWLLYWLIPFFLLVFYAPLQAKTLLGLLLLFLFLPIYRKTFWVQGTRLIPYIAAEVLLIAVLALISNPSVLYMMFYPAVIIGMLSRMKHLILSLIGLVLVNLFVIFYSIGFNLSLASEWFGLFVSLFSMVITPFGVWSGRRRRQLAEQLAQANSEIQRLSKIEERQRIARDLHDTLGHTLSMITLKSELAEKLIQKNPERAAQEIHDIQVASRSALSQVRELVADMRTVDFQEELDSAKQILAAANIQFRYLDQSQKAMQQPTLRTTLLAMCMREAITNVVRHSQATLCEVQVIEDDTTLSLTIRDNGIGVQQSQSQGCVRNEQSAIGGNGLFGIRQRLELVNGTLQIESQPHKGTTFTIRVPKIVTGKGGVR